MRVGWLRRALIAPLALALVVGAGAAVVPIDADAQQQPQRQRPWLGVSMGDDSGQQQQQAQGVKVKHVVRTSPADKGGVRENDRIVSVDSNRVATSQEVIRIVAAKSVGDTIGMTLAREPNNQTIQARVTLGAFPTSDEMIRMDHVGAFAPAWRGVEQVRGAVPRSIDGLRGRVVLLDFWATWCGPCRILQPKLGALQDRYGAQGLSVIGLTTEEQEPVSLYAQRMQLKYAVGVDKRAETSQAYTVASLPTLFIIDKKGVVRDVAVGYDPSRESQIDALVRQLLNEPAPQNPGGP